MPSSLTRFLSRALEYSSIPPVSVCGTVTQTTRLEAFLGSIASVNPSCPKTQRPIASQSIFQRICLLEPPTSLDLPNQREADLASCVPPSLKRCLTGTGILNLFSIAYAFRPQLRGRLTLGGRTFPRKPWDSGGQDSHLAYRYSCPHNRLCAVQRRLRFAFDPHTTLLYPALLTQDSRSFGYPFSPVYFRRKITRLVSYYALFKWWLPLSQHPSCLSNFTSFST